MVQVESDTDAQTIEIPHCVSGHFCGATATKGAPLLLEEPPLLHRVGRRKQAALGLRGGEAVAGELKIRGIALDTDKAPAKLYTGNPRRARAHEGIEDRLS